ncbi:MAG: hypothetical protein AB9842_14570 [Bacteroidales bacterium]
MKRIIIDPATFEKFSASRLNPTQLLMVKGGGSNPPQPDNSPSPPPPPAPNPAGPYTE